MKQYKEYPVSAPHHRVTADFAVCTYEGCDATPHPHFKAPLCMAHGKMIAVQAMTFALPAKEPEQPTVARGPATPGHVYIVQHGDRIKIGFSKQVNVRLTAIPHEKVLAVVVGDRRLEHALLTKFKSIRTTGEWFEAHPELIAFAENLAKKAA